MKVVDNDIGESLNNSDPGELSPDKKKYLVSLEPREVSVTSQEKKFIDEFLDIVEKDITNQNLNIEAICKELAVGRATLNRKLKKITGESPMQFIQSYRLKLAKQLLEKNAGNVAEVAEMVGFSDEFNFSKSFKKKFGKPPKVYQDEYLKNAADKTKEKPAEPPPTKPPPKKMSIQFDFTIDELDREYIARVVATKSEQMFIFSDTEGTPQRDEIIKQVEMLYDPPIPLASNEALKAFTLREIMNKMRHKIEKMRRDARAPNRPGVYSDMRLDLISITGTQVRSNALAVAAVCMKEDLLPGGSGCFKLRIKNYGKTFNLCTNEPFYHQPTAAGRMCTAVLVGEDVVVTTAQMVNENNVTDICFVFGYALQKANKPAEQISNENIYKGLDILHRVQSSEVDLVLVKLDRKVTDRQIAILSQTDIRKGQPVYVMGHPCGLPLKYAPGALIADIFGSYFTADIDVYGSGSGSPVFCAETHELIGIVSRAHTRDFRWTGKCWTTMRYPKSGSNDKNSQIAKTTEFSKL